MYLNDVLYTGLHECPDGTFTKYEVIYLPNKCVEVIDHIRGEQFGVVLNSDEIEIIQPQNDKENLRFFVSDRASKILRVEKLPEEVVNHE